MDEPSLMRDGFLKLDFYPRMKNRLHTLRYSDLITDTMLQAEVLLHRTMLTSFYVRNTKTSIGGEYNVPEVCTTEVFSCCVYQYLNGCVLV